MLFTHVLGAAAVALVGVIAAELTMESGTQRAEPVVAPQFVPRRLPPPPDHREQREAWVTTTLARPLFELNRRPYVPMAVVAAAPPISPPPQPTGTLVSPEGKRAIFRKGDKSTVVGEGSSIDDIWIVETISPGAVTVAGPDGSHVLPVTYAKDGPAKEIRTSQQSRTLRPIRTHNRTELAARR